jgi:outer membrane lipoprotein-sorting protein
MAFLFDCLKLYMLGNKLFYLTLGILLLTVIGGSSFGQQPSLSGEQIVRKMAEQYTSAKSYFDVGVVQTVSAADERLIETNVSFKTYFERPNKMRFEWEEGGQLKSWHIVWSDGKDVFTYWDSGGLKREESLSLALAGATGISRGAAHTVPVLLLQDVGFKLTEMSNTSLVREEQLEGEDCFVVKGFHPFGFPIDLWISKNDFLLRKEREQNEDKTFVEEIRRNVKLNATFPAETFQYTPPSPKKDSLTSSCLPVILLSLALFLLASLKR